MRTRSHRADVRVCSALLRRGSRSFHAAGRLLPPGARDDLAALYAFCRIADDAIDEGGDPAAALHGLRRRLDRVYASRPRDAVERALHRVASRHRIPRDILAAMLDGFAWEVERRRYRTLSDVRAYSVRVAGTVGIMVSLVLGRRDRGVLARAVDLGVAMQLTNICRDVGEDARMGRFYLPTEWIDAEGLDLRKWLRHPTACPPIRSAVRRLLHEASILYRRAESGISLLPIRCRPAIWSARYIYEAIGDVIVRRGHDSVAGRAATTWMHKTVLCARALHASIRHDVAGGATREPVLEEGRFLLEAVDPPVPPIIPTESPQPEGARVAAI